MNAITPENLKPFEGKSVVLSCTVGVVLCNIIGTLKIGYGFCAYGVRLTNGEMIGFTYGKFAVDNEQLIVHIQ